MTQDHRYRVGSAVAADVKRDVIEHRGVSVGQNPERANPERRWSRRRSGNRCGSRGGCRGRLGCRRRHSSGRRGRGRSRRRGRRARSYRAPPRTPHIALTGVLLDRPHRGVVDRIDHCSGEIAPSILAGAEVLEVGRLTRLQHHLAFHRIQRIARQVNRVGPARIYSGPEVDIAEHHVAVLINGQRREGVKVGGRGIVDTSELLHLAKRRSAHVYLPPLRGCASRSSSGRKLDGMRGPQRTVAVHAALDAPVLGVDVLAGAELRSEINDR